MGTVCSIGTAQIQLMMDACVILHINIDKSHPCSKYTKVIIVCNKIIDRECGCIKVIDIVHQSEIKIYSSNINQEQFHLEQE